MALIGALIGALKKLHRPPNIDLNLTLNVVLISLCSDTNDAKSLQ